MMDFQYKHVLITGAGSGIGRESACAFAARGAHIIAIDCSKAGLHETQSLITRSKGRCTAYVADISDQESMTRLAAVIHEEVGAIDILVNNAGVGAAGRFMDSEPATWRRVLDINVTGVMLCCHLFLPPMLERGRGHIVNLASMASYFASPEMAVYATSKYAVLGFSEALRGDLKKKGIGVTAICPGVVNTNIVDTSIVECNADNWRSDAARFYSQRNYPPSKVAKAILKAVEKNTAVKPVTPEAWIIYHLKRLLPGLGRQIAAHPLPFIQRG